MPRPDRSDERRRELMPVLARTFADLGYRRATTAELARRCLVQETILYRLWPDKRAMFIAALDFVYRFSEECWTALLAEEEEVPQDPVERILAFESTHHGEFGLYRIVFAGLSETDDAEIRAALRGLYTRFHAFACTQLGARQGAKSGLEPKLAAWAILGLGTVVNIGRELELMSAADQQRLFTQAGRRLLGS